jgi:hypothetical protein
MISHIIKVKIKPSVLETCCVPIVRVGVGSAVIFFFQCIVSYVVAQEGR